MLKCKQHSGHADSTLSGGGGGEGVLGEKYMGSLFKQAGNTLKVQSVPRRLSMIVDGIK